MRPFTLALALAAALSAVTTTSHSVPLASPALADYTVFIDPPTGFVFVKLPQGWRFAGQRDGATTARLPSNVVTRLLPVDAEDARQARGNQVASKL